MSDIENVANGALVIENTSDSNQLNLPEAYWPLYQKISKLSWQMSASFTFSLQMGVLVYLLSQLDDSEDNLAAITLITSLINSIVCIGVSPLLAMSLVTGKEVGELKDAESHNESEEQLQARRKHISAALGNGFIISAAMAPAMILSMVFSKSILTNLLNQNATVAEITQNFVRPYSIAVPAIMTRVCTDQIMYLFGRTKPAMIIGLTNFAFSMSLGSILAFGKLGAPKLGSTGILIGGILDSYLTAIGYSLYLAKSPRLKQFNFFDFYQSWQPYFDQLNEIRNLGRSIMFSMTVETAMNLTTNIFAGMVGVQQQASLSAIMQFSLFSLLLQIAFGQTVAQEMSREIGASRFNHASRIGKVGIIAMLSYITPVLLGLAAYPNILVDILGNNNQSFKHTLQYLAPIMFVGCILDAARFLILQEMRVLGDAKKSAFISSSCIALGILLSGLLGLKTKMGIYGIATGYTSSLGLAVGLLLTQWVQKIQPSAIEENKKNPEQFFSIKSCCASFFNRREPQSPKNADIEMATVYVNNPISNGST